jgi:hypothetical protein
LLKLTRPGGRSNRFCPEFSAHFEAHGTIEGFVGVFYLCTADDGLAQFLERKDECSSELEKF